MAEKIRIAARPDGEGWIDYRYNGIWVGSSKPGLASWLLTPGLEDFIKEHNLQAPTKPL